MRNFDRNIPEETEEQSHPVVANEPVDMNRRGFLGAVLATAFLTACGKVDADNSTYTPAEQPDTAETIAQKHDLPTIRKMIVERHPNLGHYISVREKSGTEVEKQVLKVNFRELGRDAQYNDDILVRAYLLKVSYNGLLNDRVIDDKDMLVKLNYLDTYDKMWPKKLAKVCANHKTDMELARANLQQFDREHPQKEEMTYQKFVDITTGVVKDVSARMAELRQSDSHKYDLINEFTELIDTDFLVGLSIHEVMPADYNDVTRITILRALFEEGFEINTIPAVYDDVASFGPLQMSVMPYEGRNRDDPFGAKTGKRSVTET
ncbi:MAG: hypothetical protein AAB932_00620, partial [Patescibacteria group bacterium]